MDRKTVHIVGAGGPAGVGMTRSLKEWYDLTGEDSSQWGRLMMECEEYKIGMSSDMIICLPDKSLDQSSFKPHYEQIAFCQDKAKTATVLGELSQKLLWMRDVYGSGGSGAQMAQEYLPGRNFSCELVYQDGVLLQNFIKERISYSVKGKTGGLEDRGTSAVSVCRRMPDLLQLALEAIGKVVAHTGEKANGFYGIDFKENEAGEPKVTEINAGRLLTASYPYFYQTGFNLPLVGVRAFFGESRPELPDYPEGWGLVWQLGQKPRVVPPDITKDWK